MLRQYSPFFSSGFGLYQQQLVYSGILELSLLRTAADCKSYESVESEPEQ